MNILLILQLPHTISPSRDLNTEFLKTLINEYTSIAKNDQIPFYIVLGSKGYLNEKYLSSGFPCWVVILTLFLIAFESFMLISIDQFEPIGT